MGSDRGNMPAFGVGPMYVLSCLFLTAMGILCRNKGFIAVGRMEKGRYLFIAAGIFFFLAGLYLWIQAVIIQKINAKARASELITTGVYSVVRNPVYTAFIFIFTGALLFAANVILLILPFIFWAMLTLLMKQTEEKWLLRQFGEEYAAYCKEVNRVIPWFSKRKS